MIVGQGPIALAVGAGVGVAWTFFSHLSFLFSFSLSLGDGPIQTEILSKRAVKPKNNRSINTNLSYPSKEGRFPGWFPLDKSRNPPIDS